MNTLDPRLTELTDLFGQLVERNPPIRREEICQVLSPTAVETHFDIRLRFKMLKVSIGCSDWFLRSSQKFQTARK